MCLHTGPPDSRANVCWVMTDLWCLTVWAIEDGNAPLITSSQSCDSEYKILNLNF